MTANRFFDLKNPVTTRKKTCSFSSPKELFEMSATAPIRPSNMTHRLIELVGLKKQPLGCFFDQYPVYELFYSSSSKVSFQGQEYSLKNLETVLLDHYCIKEQIETVIQIVRRLDTHYCYVDEEGNAINVEYDVDR